MEIRDEHRDFASGNIVAAIYNVNRDGKKSKAIEWWEIIPRWYPKYRIKKMLAQQDALKAALIGLAEKQRREEEKALRSE